MIYIAVCDDDRKVTEYLCRYLEAQNKKLEAVSISISVYHSGAALLLDIGRGSVFHILFLDIEMVGLNGIEVGQLFRKKPNGDDAIIIYISGHNTYFRELVDIGAFRFLSKPLKVDELEQVFEKALHQAVKYKNAMTPRRFAFKLGADIHSICTDEIVYMQNRKRIVSLYTWNDAEKSPSLAHKFYAKMEDVAEQLPEEHFVRCGRSNIVNLKYVQRLARDSFVLRDQVTMVAVGKTYKEEMKKKFFWYLGG